MVETIYYLGIQNRFWSNMLIFLLIFVFGFLLYVIYLWVEKFDGGKKKNGRKNKDTISSNGKEGGF